MATQKKKSSTKQKKAAPKTNTAQRESTRRALTDDAKQARMEVWATKLGVSKDVVHQLNDKYGSYSYTMMQRAMAEPAKLMSDVGEGYKGSKGAVEYLAKGTLTSEQIAKVTGEKSTLKVDNNLAQAQLDAARREAAAIEAGKRNNPVAQAKKEADKKNDKLVARVDNKKQQDTGDNKARAAIRDEAARKEQERVRAAKAAQEKAAQEKAAQEKAAQEKALAAKERVAKEKAEQEAKAKGNTGDKKDQASIPLAPWQQQNAQNVAKIDSTQVTVKPIITKEGSHNVLKSQAFVAGKPIQELKDSTEQSLFGVTHQREVGVCDNPTGKKGFDGKNYYYGAMQHNPDGIKNISLYAVTHPEQYGDYANKVFDTKSKGYKDDLKAFQNDVAKRGKDAYRLGSTARTKLLSHIKSDYLSTFTKEGKAHSEQMLQLQRDGASSVTAAFYNLDGIAATLKQQGINPTDVNPSVWGMVISAGIAKGNTNYVVTNSKTGKVTRCSAANLFKGKTLEQINSPQMIDRIAGTYRSVFHSKSEMAAVQWAKDHVNEKQSVTTARELSMMLGDDQMYENYLAKVAANQSTNNGQTKMAQAAPMQITTTNAALMQKTTLSM